MTESRVLANLTAEPNSCSLSVVRLVRRLLRTLAPDVGASTGRIAFLRGDAGAAKEVWVMETDGSNLHRIVEVTMAEASVTAGDGKTNQPYASVFLAGVAWSPDGTRVAYIRRYEGVSPGPPEDNYSLETVGINGGTRRVLKVSPQLLPVVCWAADGRLLFGFRDSPSTERMDFGIWSLRVNHKSGMPEGKEVRVTKGAGQIGGLSVSADGRRLVLWRDNLHPTVFLTEIDPQSHHVDAITRNLPILAYGTEHSSSADCGGRGPAV